MSNVPVLAGIASTIIFAASTLPMLVKAYRSRDLSSYSLGNIGLANVGNAVHSVYVLSLPPGPLWVLHGFYLTSTALMLVWFLRYRVANPGGGLPITPASRWVDRPTRPAYATS
jgi:hypothetical protein